MNIEQAYERVNEVKPEGTLTSLTLPEAEKAVRKMYRHLTGKVFRYPVVETTGNRITWIRHGKFVVNVARGWSDLIHLFSHWYYAYHIGGRPHSKVHARLERKLRKWAIGKGWMNGSLRGEEKVEQPIGKDEVRAKLIEKRMNQIARLERKIKALTTRMKTAKRSLAGLTRASERASSSAADPLASA